MKRYSFGAFQVDESNREGYEVCREVAELKPVAPLPVVLLAADGCGKTHLLYSIVNHVRATSGSTGLAYITAHEFPEQVRALIQDPSPVKRAENAILLVDQLEGFTEHGEELGAVVRIFLDNGHYVVVATSLHPRRMDFLPQGLVAILEKGQVVQIKPRASVARNVPSEEAGPAAGQRDDIGELREQLRSVEASAAAAVKAAQQAEDEAAALRREQSALLEQNEDLQRQLDKERSEVEDLRGQVDTRRAEAEELREELDAERAAHEPLSWDLDAARSDIQALRRDLEQKETQIGELSGARDEADRLRDEVRGAQADLRAAQQDQAALTAQLVQKAALEDEAASLRSKLKKAQTECDRLRSDTERLMERVRELLAQVESGSAKSAQAEQTMLEEIRALEALLDQEGAAAAATAPPQGDWDDARNALEARLASAKAEIRTAAKAHDELTEKHDKLLAAHAALELQLEQAQTELETQAKEMEALRHEAATQTAAAHAQAGDAERGYAHIHSSFELMRQTANVVGAGLDNLQQQVAEAAEAMGKLAVRLNQMAQAEEEESADASSARQPSDDLAEDA